jgi:hypothetical protein
MHAGKLAEMGIPAFEMRMHGNWVRKWQLMKK